MSDTRVNLDALTSLPYGDVKRRVDDAAGKLDVRRKYVCGYLVADRREHPDTVAAYGSFRKQLRIATSNVAAFYGEEQQFGALEIGGPPILCF